MKLHDILKIVVAIAAVMYVTSVASADVENMNPGDVMSIHYKLPKDSTISFMWFCSDVLDFYITDSLGNKYMVYNDVRSLTGEFTVPYDSTWYVVWSNDNTIFPVALTYDVSASLPSRSISVLYIIAIVMIVAALLMKMKR